MTCFEIFRSCFPEYDLTEDIFNELVEAGNSHIISEEGGAALINGNKIAFFAVHPDYQGKGIGSRILEKAEEYIKNGGSEYAYLRGIFPAVPFEARNFFENKGYETEEIYSEMGMDIKDFRAYRLTVPENVTFRYYDGDHDELLKLVAAVDKEWVQYFSCDDNVFCGYFDGKPASFCIVNESVHCLMSDGKNKVGSIGCVGTHPDYRRQGTGLRMVELATEYLAEKGCDKCLIHYTTLTDWYGRLGYRTFLSYTPARKKL